MTRKYPDPPKLKQYLDHNGDFNDRQDVVDHQTKATIRAIAKLKKERYRFSKIKSARGEK